MQNIKMIYPRERGATTLVITLMLITLSLIIIIFAANYGITQSKSIANIQRQQQAFNAAEAGLEFGISYLTTNNAAILASPVSGYLAPFTNSSVTNVALANGSSFSITYSNPVANNYQLIQISSTGINDDNTATHTVMQLVQFGSTLANVPIAPLVSVGEVTLSGNSQIVNTSSATTIQTGATVTMAGSSSTVTSSGTSSTPGNIQSDIQQNVGAISGISNADFFATYFGQTAETIKGTMQNTYSNSSDTNYSTTLDGMSGTSIWIDQTGGTTATINGDVTIGSATNPVLMIINGNIMLNGNITIYGFVYVNGTTSSTLLGHTNIIGSIANAGSLSASSGSVQINYSPSVLSNLQNAEGMRYYAKIPGSWKDF